MECYSLFIIFRLSRYLSKVMSIVKYSTFANLVLKLTFKIFLSSIFFIEFEMSPLSNLQRNFLVALLFTVIIINPHHAKTIMMTHTPLFASKLKRFPEKHSPRFELFRVVSLINDKLSNVIGGINTDQQPTVILTDDIINSSRWFLERVSLQVTHSCFSFPCNNAVKLLCLCDSSKIGAIISYVQRKT